MVGEDPLRSWPEFLTPTYFQEDSKERVGQQGGEVLIRKEMKGRSMTSAIWENYCKSCQALLGLSPLLHG